MSRKKAEKPSEELLKLIDLANLAPPKQPLPNSDFLIAKLYYEKTGKLLVRNMFGWHYIIDESIIPTSEQIQTQFEIEKQVLEEIKQLTKKFPLFYNYVFNETGKTEYNIAITEKTEREIKGQAVIVRRLTKYDSILLIQKILRDIALCSTILGEDGEFNDFNFELPGYLDFIIPVRWQIIEGRLEFEITHITEPLKGIDVRRLKICRVCYFAFWAYRLDKKYCDDKCGNLFRVEKSNAKKAEKESKRKEEREKFKNQIFSKKERK